MHWQLWDTEIGGLVATYPAEAEALQGVRDLLSVNSAEYVEVLALGAMYDEGEQHDIELPPVLEGEELKARLAQSAPSEAEVTARNVHERIREWLAEEGWHVEDIPTPPESFNIVGVRPNGQAINVFQPKGILDHVALSLRWSYDRVRQLIGKVNEDKFDEIVWDIYRDISLMGVDIYDAKDPPGDMIFRTHVYFDGLTKDSLMQRIQLVNRAYALAMRTSVRAQETPARSAGHALSPEDIRRIMRPVAEAAGTLTVAS